MWVWSLEDSHPSMIGVCVGCFSRAQKEKLSRGKKENEENMEH